MIFLLFSKYFNTSSICRTCLKSKKSSVRPAVSPVYPEIPPVPENPLFLSSAQCVEITITQMLNVADGQCLLQSLFEIGAFSTPRQVICQQYKLIHTMPFFIEHILRKIGKICARFCRRAKKGLLLIVNLSGIRMPDSHNCTQQTALPCSIGTDDSCQAAECTPDEYLKELLSDQC